MEKQYRDCFTYNKLYFVTNIRFAGFNIFWYVKKLHTTFGIKNL